jgi:hypothetical protein
MSASDFLAAMRSVGATLWVEGGQLKLSAPAAVLTPELIERLNAHAPELLALAEFRALMQRLRNPPPGPGGAP